MNAAKPPRSQNQHKLLLRTTKIGLMFTVPYASRLSISGRGRRNLMEEIGFLTVKCVVCGGGVGAEPSPPGIGYLLRDNNRSRSVRRTAHLLVFGGINLKTDGRLHAMPTNAINHDPRPVVTSLMTPPFGPAVPGCQHKANGALSYLVWRS